MTDDRNGIRDARRDHEPSIEAGVRRVQLPDPEAVGEDEVLVARLRAEIRAHGPITFARFMERALYEPGHGYYRRPRPAPGPAGDFLTAPEIHPIFGAAVGRLIEQAWDVLGRPSPFVVTEHGAGTGALAEGLLGGLRGLGSPLLPAVRYRPIEIEPQRVEAVAVRLRHAGLDGHLIPGLPGRERETPERERETPERERRASGSERDPVAADEVGAVIANEVLDALPVHRVIGRPGGLRELLVGLDPEGAFVTVESAPTTPALAARLAAEGVELADGQAAEVCPALEPWLRDAVHSLATGIVVLIDYAEEPGQLHAAGRDGTLRAFAGHAVGADPFRHVGRQDLTATVDLAAVRAAAASVGLEPLGETTQAELLAAVATGDLARAYLDQPGGSLQDALRLRSALARLLDPRGMGGFRVLAFGRGLPAGASLEGLRRLRPRG